MPEELHYKGYSAKPEYSADDQIFYGVLLGIGDLVTFEAENAQDIETEFRSAVDDYLEFCKEIGKVPQLPVNGKPYTKPLRRGIIPYNNMCEQEGASKMPLPKEERYTLADALDWPEDERIELVEGKAVMMAPPKRIHQEVSVELVTQIREFLRGKRCKVYPAPFAVRLFEQDGERPEDVDTMLEPDITVVCDPDKLDEIGCKGAPDMVIEILSPSTARNDRIVKYRLYERAGVREYWIIDPDTKTVNVHLLEDGQYHSPVAYTGKAKVPVSLWNGFSVDLAQVFPED